MVRAGGALMARARVFKSGRLWEWRCTTTCDNFGGGGTTWLSAMYGVKLHLHAHDRDAPYLKRWAR